MTDESTPGQNGADPSERETEEAETSESELGAASVERLVAEAADWRDKALRAAAEAENTKRRAEREMNDARAYAIQRFARDLLDAADTLELALKNAPEGSADAAVAGFVTGVHMTEKKLQTAFEKNGLKKLDPARGDTFDPHLHQAMMEQPGDGAPPGSVLQTMQAGYELFGRVVRPAMVIVAAKSAPSPAPSADPAAGGAYAADETAAGSAFDTKA